MTRHQDSAPNTHHQVVAQGLQRARIWLHGVLAWARPHALPLALACVATLVAFIKLHYPSFIGAADTGDFSRITLPLGMDHQTQDPMLRYFNYIDRYYAVQPLGYRGLPYLSSTLFVVGPLVLFCHVLGIHVFDLAYLGYVYLVGFGVGVYLLLSGVQKLTGSRLFVVLVAVLGTLMLTDLAYIIYLHSFFDEATAFIFVLLALGAAVNLAADQRPQRGLSVLYFLATLGVVIAKTQYLPLLIFLIPLGLRLTWSDRRPSSRVLTGGIIALTLGLGALSYLHVNPDITRANQFQTVFDGVLSPQRTVAANTQSLHDLGLSPSYIIYVGKSYYAPDIGALTPDPAFQAGFYHRVSITLILKYYLTHPGEFLTNLQSNYGDALVLRSPNSGNYVVGGGPPLALSHRFDIWGALRGAVYPRSLAFLALFALAYGVVLVALHRRARSLTGRMVIEIAAVVLASALIQFPVPLIAAGYIDMTKHQYLFNLLLDLSVLIALSAGVFALLRRSGVIAPPSTQRPDEPPKNAADDALAATVKRPRVSVSP